ncbi:MAG: ABC transporter substrate-binding protein [Solirubrobacterales bacterium]|nr:ABC transporter substrate-binding protein [Solirubrobacterales bacterium]
MPERALDKPRRIALAGTLVVAAVALAACGAAEGGPQTGGSPDVTGDAFPVTIEHKYGTTEVGAPPERVLSLGFNEQDFALALGVRPIAVREWMGERPSATWPWAQDELGDAEPEVLPAGELNCEQIAALRPDLILATYAGITESDYEKLSRIAPTVAQTDEYVDYGMPWQEQTLMIGRALGRESEAERLVAEIERQFERARQEHPEFGRAVAIAAYQEESGSIGAYSSQDPRGRFLASLGFRAPAEIDDLAGDQFFTRVSGEQLRLIDEDVLVMVDIGEIAASRDELLGDPLYRRPDVVRDGADVYPDEEVAAALSFSTPLSLPLAIEELVPELAAAVEATSGAGAGDAE